jgi:hypothetical protein
MSPEATIKARAPRCRMLDEHLNRCGGLELEGTGLCVGHLGRAANDFRRLVGEIGAMPGVAAIRGGDDR